MEMNLASGNHWLAPNIGAIIGQIAFMRNPGHMKLLQQMAGVEMWLAGCSREAFARLNHLGLCLSIHAVRRCIDMIRWQYADDLLQQKSLLTNRTPQAKRRLFDNDEPFSKELGVRMLDDTGSTELYYALEQDSLSESNEDQVNSTDLTEDTIHCK
ncbi:hypothetical protein ACJMK2_002228 [Sinanodonta woodiana]|uniref:Uncharacterized protein n=1 Tax=Sinanodonta woodiana TaxID=1069815 RepID=A0ABD3XUL1_SINWO